MSNPSKAKGSTYERETERAGIAAGVPAKRVIFSGAYSRFNSQYIGDIDVQVRGVDKKIECKRRARGFARFYEWLRPEIYCVFFRDDHEESLVMLRATDFWELVKQQGNDQ